jgi:hypothetical protein
MNDQANERQDPAERTRLDTAVETESQPAGSDSAATKETTVETTVTETSDTSES